MLERVVHHGGMSPELCPETTPEMIPGECRNTVSNVKRAKKRSDFELRMEAARGATKGDWVLSQAAVGINKSHDAHGTRGRKD